MISSGQMLAGTAQADITPEPGIELCGFAVRPQPSASVLDRLAIRALYLEDGPERFLWLHADLLALDQQLVARIRKRVEVEAGIAAGRLMVSATHTHSGPGTIRLIGCGRPVPAYTAWVEGQFATAARGALSQCEPCELWAAEGRCELAVDRRGFASAHTDPRVGAIAWRRKDGSFKAVVLSYAMHAVCLRGTGISADWPGEAARVLKQSLRGGPVVLACAGACCNLNPPSVGVAAPQMRGWGRQIAASILPESCFVPVAPVCPGRSLLKVKRRLVTLPLEPSSPQEVMRYADACLAEAGGHREFGPKFRLAVETWRQDMMRRLADGRLPFAEAELFGLALGKVVFIGVNAELFSQFGTLIRANGARAVYPVSCANGMIGYVPTLEAYDEGGYEVDWSMLFYSMLRPKRGSLELLVQNAGALVAEVAA
ncbi:MAG: neutral/alkaline non-lysosomal ceramidase N-terminal domain-containing protein [Verrucomicrobiota bacterium]|jgi:hypothetical protein